MVLRKINLQSVVNDEEGFQVSRISRSYLKYSENDLVLLIEVESGEDDQGRYDLGVYWPSILTWQPPSDRIPITPQKREEIRDRVEQSLKSLKINASHIEI